MTDDSIYSSLGKLTEEMYLSLAKSQSSQMQDQLLEYHSIAEKKISDMLVAMGKCKSGKMLLEYKKKLQILHDDFCYMRNDINSKYKIYLRGCGNAGKSTLLNALLSLNESEGSRMGRLPMTSIIDIYTDELSTKEAEVRTIGSDGNGKYIKMSREQAIRMQDEEERKSAESKEKCQKEIEKEIKRRNVHLEEYIKDITQDIYDKWLYKIGIREIRWGIGKNNFFHNCILIDTPGLSQESEFTNIKEGVESYEVDGIIWVISSEFIQKHEVIELYEDEMKKMEKIYKGRKIIAVINMYGEGDDYKYGSRLWKRYEKKARAIYSEERGFAHLVCVNAKLAYEGNLSGNEDDIDKSNIAELRKVINEMFVERTTEAYNRDKLKKIDDFLSNLYRDTAEIENELEKEVSNYKDKQNKIKNQVIACNNLVREDKDKVIRKHLVEIKANIEKNSEYVQTLGSRSEYEIDSFIQNDIVHADEIQRDISNVMKECGEKIYKRFCDQQRQSIISRMNTEEYKIRDFENKNTGIIITSKENVPSFQYKVSVWQVASKAITDIFGNNDVTRFLGKIIEGIQNAIKSPQNRLYDSIKLDLLRWVEQFDLTQMVNEYEKLCTETLNKSMAQVCGEYEDILTLLNVLDEFNNDIPHMVWKEIHLEELIGGYSNG
jgi:hypothetical protein